MIKINNLYLALEKNVFNGNLILNEDTLLQFIADFNKIMLDESIITKHIIVNNLLWFFSNCYNKKILKETFLVLYKFKLAYHDLYLDYDDGFCSSLMKTNLFKDLSELIITYSYSHDIEFYKSCCHKFINDYLWDLDMNYREVNFDEIKRYIDILSSLDSKYFEVSLEHLKTYYVNHEINVVTEFNKID